MGNLADMFKKVDAIIIVNSLNPDPNFFYFSGLSESPFEGSLFLMNENEKILIVPPLDFRSAKSQVKFPVYTYKSSPEITAIIRKFVGTSVKIGLNYNKLNMTNYTYLKNSLPDNYFTDVSENLTDLRQVKNASEITKISKACSITSKVAREIPEFAKAGMTELQVAAEIEKRMKDSGGDDFAFNTIVASGKNSAKPHHYAGKRILKKGDLVMMDFGCKYENYCSDLTRTFVVGKPNKKQKEIHKLCLKMQEQAIKMYKPGAIGRTIQEKMNKMAGKYGPMLHSIGHGVGLEVHESPGLGRKSIKPFKPGMVVTVEPGIYVPSIGGVRIEDDILITSDGSKVLTDAPRELISI